MKSWVQFARGGDPLEADGVRWPRWTTGSPAALRLGPEVTVGEMPEAAVAAFWSFLR